MKILWILITSNITFTLSVALYKYDLEELDNAEALRKTTVSVLAARITKAYCLHDKVILSKSGAKMSITQRQTKGYGMRKFLSRTLIPRSAMNLQFFSANFG